MILNYIGGNKELPCINGDRMREWLKCYEARKDVYKRQVYFKTI